MDFAGIADQSVKLKESKKRYKYLCNIMAEGFRFIYLAFQFS